MTGPPPEPEHRRHTTMGAGRGPALVVALPVVTALLAAMQFPFAASPGAASAQVLAVVGGIALAIALALRAARRHPDGFESDIRWGAAAASLAVVTWALVSLASEALRPACGGSLGLTPFIVLAFPVLLLQGAVGAWVGRLAGRTARAVWLVLAIEVGAIVTLVIGFHGEPQFRLVSHLFVALSTEQLWGSAAPDGAELFRGATLLFALALAAFGIAWFPAHDGGRTLRPRRAWLAGAALLTVGLLVDHVARRTLAPSRAQFEAAYAYGKARGPLVLHADPLAVTPAEVDLLLAEGNLWLGRIEARLGLRPQQPIHVWVHATAEEKARWTGASRADFALPWRHEVHLRRGGAPHPTLGHELVHIIAGELLTTLFRTPGRFIFAQNPALVEGLAVAVAPELKSEHDLTILEDAAALKRLGRLGPASQLLGGLDFLGEAHQRAYIAAGSVLSAFAVTQPDAPRALREVYRSGSIAASLGSDSAARAFFRGYEALLDSLTLPDGALAGASETFAEPSILRGTCPGVRAPPDPAWRVHARSGAVPRALALLEADTSATAFWQVQREALDVADTTGALAVVPAILLRTDSVHIAATAMRQGDLFARSGNMDAALATWGRAPARGAPPALARSLLARRLLATELAVPARSHLAALAALRYLTDTWEEDRDAAALALAATLARADASTDRTAAEPALGRSLSAYLLARRLRDDRDPAATERLLARVHAEALLPSPLAEEATIMFGQALALNGRGREAATLLRAAAARATRAGLKQRLADLAERAERGAAAPPRPRVISPASDPAWADRLLVGGGSVR